MPRVYERRFDHDEARALRARGLPYAEIGRLLAVSPKAVTLACDPRERARNALNQALRQQGGRCVDCGGRCSRNASQPALRCRECAGLAKRTSVRPATLSCSRCKRWLPDNDFPFNRGCEARRGRHQLCRACNTAERRNSRERSKVPCVECGEPRLPGNEKKGRDTGLCLTCYHRGRKRAAP